MTNCPGTAASFSSNMIVLVEGVSARCSAIVNILTPARVSHPHHLTDRFVSVVLHELEQLVAHLVEHSDSFGPDCSADLDCARARHYVFKRVPAASDPPDADDGYLHCLVDL